MDDAKFEKAKDLKAEIESMSDKLEKAEREIVDAHNRQNEIAFSLYAYPKNEAGKRLGCERTQLGISREEFPVTFDNVLAIVRDSIRRDLGIARTLYEAL